MSRATPLRQAESNFNSSDRVNAELFALTYGSLVSRLIKDAETIPEVNRQLELMGYNIGQRLIDDFLSKTDVSCDTIRETAEVVAKAGFKMYLGIVCDVGNWAAGDKEFSLFVYENPITDFVELSDEYQNLHYLNLICGVIRGALEMVRYKTNCFLIKDSLKGDEFTEIRVEVLEYVLDEYVPDDA